MHLRGEVDPRKVEVDPATDGRYVFLVNVVRFSSGLTRRCPRDPQSCVLLVNCKGKSPSGSPDPIFYGNFAARKIVPGGVGPPCSGHLGGQSRRLGSAELVVSSRRNAHFHKTVRAADRRATLSGRSKLILRPRGEVDPRRKGGRVENAPTLVRNRRF